MAKVAWSSGCFLQRLKRPQDSPIQSQPDDNLNPQENFFTVHHRKRTRRNTLLTRLFPLVLNVKCYPVINHYLGFLYFNF